MSNTKKPTELGTKNIGKLLYQYSLPAIIAMTAASIYHITDSIFIGHGVGALAISGLAITFPFMNLAAAVGSLVGAGGATLLSIRMGQKDYDSANVILGNVITLNVILGITFSILALLFMDPILLFFGASETTLPYARDYMGIILFGNLFTHLFMGLNALLRSSGHPEKAMVATIMTVIINLILNSLFIFGFKWGISGSALATVISQIVMLVWQLNFFSNSKNFIHFKKEAFRLKYRIVKEMLAIGMSPFMMNAAATVIVIVINQGLIRTGGDLAVGAYGIVNRIAFLFVMIVMGFNQGMQPIAGYNYGARLFSRVDEVLKKTIVRASIVTTTGFLLGVFFPQIMVSIFTNDKELIGIAAGGMRIVFLTFPIIGFQMVTANFFQSIGMPGKSIFMSLSRQLLFLLPCLLILPYFWGINGIWYSMPISDAISSILAAILLFRQLKFFKENNLDNS